MPLRPPPLDANGAVQPHDHDEIGPGDGIIRRISEKQLIVDKVGQRRISSIAFKPSTGPNGGMSVDLERSIIDAGLDPQTHVTTPYWTGSVRFEAGAIREEGFQVGYHPLTDNPHHGEVWGDFSKARQRRLQALAVWFVPIPGVLTSAA